MEKTGYRSVDELTHDEMVELKQRYISELNQANGEGTSLGELMDADSLVTDEEIRKEYSDTVFSVDDFWCNLEEAV